MPGTLHDLSATTVSDNDDALLDVGLDWREGQTPGSINNSMRAALGAIRAHITAALGAASTGGSSNAYTYTSPGVFTLRAYVTGVRISFLANHTNTDAATLNVDGLGAKAITKNGTTALVPGDIVSGRWYEVVYDGTQFQMQTVPAGVYQPLDATLTALAALSTSADQIIYATGSDTFALSSVTSFARTVLDDANAATARTTLGLGTAATQNTGTSGANVPLMNGTNTWSGAQAFSSGVSFGPIFLTDGSSNQGGRFLLDLPNSGSSMAGDIIVEINTNTFRLFEAGGSFRGIGIDLSTCASSAASVFATTATTQTFTNKTLSSPTISGTVAGAPTWASAQNFPSGSQVNGVDIVNLSAAQTLTNKSVNLASNTLAGTIAQFNSACSDADFATLAGSETLTNKTLTAPTINGGTIQSRVQVSSETSGTLTSASANKVVACSGNITLPNSVFAAGDMIVFDPGTSNRTFTRGSGIAMYLNGADVASATLRDNEMGSVYWRSVSVAILSGAFE